LAGFNRDDNRLGATVQLCALPWLGWIPDDLAVAAAAVNTVQLPALLAALCGEAGGVPLRPPRTSTPRAFG
jgi:hypothetical protein